MTRAAIYARFSSDLQADRSIGDQVALCCAYAEQKGYTVARIYSDAAASGASLHGRPEILKLLAQAETGTFNVLLVESMSRIGRDQEDRAMLRKRLKFFDIAIETPAEGVVTPIVDGVRAVLDSEMLEDMKRHTRRGMRGRVTQGLSAGGLSYGYAVGTGKGQRLIVEHEAAIVRRIFADYDRGISPRAIAEQLNRAGVKSPRAGIWRASSINGNHSRGSGILGNALYDGRLIWNRITMRKDPRTGKRVSRANAPADWIVQAVPELRIVEADLFARVQAARAGRAKHRPEAARRPKHLLSGLLRCGCCGGFMAVNNVTSAGRRIYCGTRREGGLCANGNTYPLAPIERRVVEGLKSQLAQPAAIARYLASYQAERKRLAGAAAGKRDAAERGLTQAKREIDRIVDAIARGTLDDAEARQRLAPLRTRRTTIEAELASLAPAEKIVHLHPAVTERYLAAVGELSETLNRRLIEGHEDIARALRELVVKVTVAPGDGGEPTIEVAGRLAALTGGALFPQGPLPRSTMVAGERYSRCQWPETATFRFAA